jgi:UDP-N-acetylglucosamine 2-epimerase (non-hydrolysing)
MRLRSYDVLGTYRVSPSQILTMKTIVHVVGARPNYMKVAPLMKALASKERVRQVLINTGQHYDDAMAAIFIRELGLPLPDQNLEVGSASHAVQTARVMMKFETVCEDVKPDLVSVVGDVNSTVAATLVCAKLQIPVGHVEAGLRSFDRSMPEEINRLVTDQLADLLLTPSPDADENLRREGIQDERIHRVGNIMIDTLMSHLPSARFERVRDRFRLEPHSYAVMTLHRPSNVDTDETLDQILTATSTLAAQMPVLFPVHPRTAARLRTKAVHPNVRAVEPLGYLDFLALTSNATLVITDSGGLQEETTALGIPCITVRENTERPITVTEGTNQVVGTDSRRIQRAIERILGGECDLTRKPDLWDGQASERISAVYGSFLGC